MAAKSNGQPVMPSGSSSTASGAPNGTIHTASSRSSRTKRRDAKRSTKKSRLTWVLDKGTKLLVWYTLITVLLRCPSSPDTLTEKSPVLCKPYLQARDYVAPYTRPYYDRYLDRHVQKAQPYLDRFDEQIYQPSLNFYHRYAAPRVDEAQKYGQEQWQQSIKPQIDVLQRQAGKQYEASLAPHVKKVQDVVQPYYDSFQTSAHDIWELELQPVYRNTAPYASKILEQGQNFAVQTALPQAQYAGGLAWGFWTRQIWPRMRVLYGENVEPQLMRISERLGRYKDGKKLEADMQGVEMSSRIAEASSSAEALSSSISSSATEATASPSSVIDQAMSPSPESTPDPVTQFHQELEAWEALSSKAVDEGSDDLKDRLKDITAHQISSQVKGVGSALLIQLEEASEASIRNVKNRIQQIVKDIPEDANGAPRADAVDSLVQSIRATGQNVKQRTQVVRDWRQTYQAETDDLIHKALQSTLETIDGIRELRLTDIGRRYASSSLPHKEWSRYNELKKSTQSWRQSVETVANAHSGITLAKEAAEEVEHKAMAIAEDTAKELGRLRDVGKWKIAASDDSDDFETKSIPPVAEKIKQQVVEKLADASEAILGEKDEGTLANAASVASDKVSSASEAVLGSSTGSVESVASKASEAVIGDRASSAQSMAGKGASSAQSVASAASKAASDSMSSLANDAQEAAVTASEAVVGTESSMTDSLTDAVKASSLPDGDSVVSSLSSKIADRPLSKSVGPKVASILAAQKAKKEAASKAAQDAASEGSESASSTIKSNISKAKSRTSEAYSSASSAASSASKHIPNAEDIPLAAEQATKKVFGGAMAQVLVEAREPIMDDIVDEENVYSERIQSMVGAAVDQANALTRAVEDAIKIGTATQGNIESVTSVASEQYASAMSAASSVLFSSKGVGEKGSSIARDHYLSAVTA